jgi:hypothetical protein
MDVPMKPPLVDANTFFHEKFAVLIRDFDEVGDTAPTGQVLDNLDAFLFVQGRKFLTEFLEKKIQERINNAEKLAETRECPCCKHKTKNVSKRTKTVATSNNHIHLTRTYRHCDACKNNVHPADKLIGIDSDYTEGAKRLITYAVGTSSYRRAAEMLEEFNCLNLSYQTVADVAIEVATEIETKLKDNTEVRKEFQNASGDTEITADGAFVNTRNDDGKHEWREMKVAIVAKRERGESALPEEWNSRDLPDTTVSVAVAAIESKTEFQERCNDLRRTLGVGGLLTALGDGAAWIWAMVFYLFGKVSECVDIFHVLENIGKCGKIIYKDAKKFQHWFEDMRLVLLKEGFVGIDKRLQALLSDEKLSDAKRESVQSLRAYLEKHKGRMNYRERLYEGRSIGSGMIEGACKNLVGRRMKQTGACWKVERANKIAIIAAALYSRQWKHCWMST